MLSASRPPRLGHPEQHIGKRGPAGLPTEVGLEQGGRSCHERQLHRATVHQDHRGAWIRIQHHLGQVRHPLGQPAVRSVTGLGLPGSRQAQDQHDPVGVARSRCGFGHQRGRRRTGACVVAGCEADRRALAEPGDKLLVQGIDLGGVDLRAARTLEARLLARTHRRGRSCPAPAAAGARRWSAAPCRRPRPGGPARGAPRGRSAPPRTRPAQAPSPARAGPPAPQIGSGPSRRGRRSPPRPRSRASKAPDPPGISRSMPTARPATWSLVPPQSETTRPSYPQRSRSTCPTRCVESEAYWPLTRLYEVINLRG